MRIRVPHARVLVADPPWRFGDQLGARGAEANYPTMSVEAIKAMRIPAMHDDSLLFLWRVSSMVADAIDVARAWGFEPKSEIVWVKLPRGDEHAPIEMSAEQGIPKLHFGMGRYVRMAHESCIIAARGRATRLIENRGIRSVFFARVRKHSEKPAKFYRIVESISKGPYAELFARRTRPGWDQHGNELGKLDL